MLRLDGIRTSKDVDGSSRREGWKIAPRATRTCLLTDLPRRAGRGKTDNAQGIYYFGIF
jgi:hypothetical protein